MTHRHDILRAADEYARAFGRNPCADACSDARGRVVQAVGVMEAEVRLVRGERDKNADEAVALYDELDRKYREVCDELRLMNARHERLAKCAADIIEISNEVNGGPHA